MDVVGCLFGAAVEGRQFDEDGNAREFAAEGFDQLSACEHGAPGGDEVVYEQDSLPRLNRIGVNLECVAPILKVVVAGACFPWQFAGLPDRHESGVERPGEQGAEDETAGFSAHHDIDLAVPERIHHEFSRQREAGTVPQQRRDVAKDDARMRVIGDVSNQGAEAFRHGSLL